MRQTVVRCGVWGMYATGARGGVVWANDKEEEEEASAEVRGDVSCCGGTLSLSPLREYVVNDDD